MGRVNIEKNFYLKNLSTAQLIDSINPSIRITSINLFNDNTSSAYVQLFNTASTPTLGTDIKQEIFIVVGESYIIHSDVLRIVSGPGLFGSFLDGFGIGVATTKSGSTALTGGIMVNIEYTI